MPTCSECGLHHPTDDRCPPCRCGHGEGTHHHNWGAELGRRCGVCGCLVYEPQRESTEHRVGDLKVTDNVVRRWDGQSWDVVGLAVEPVSWNIRESGVWYLPRGMRNLVHLEECADEDLMKLTKEERMVAVALLRCALERLEEL